MTSLLKPPTVGKRGIVMNKNKAPVASWGKTEKKQNLGLEYPSVSAFVNGKNGAGTCSRLVVVTKVSSSDCKWVGSAAYIKIGKSVRYALDDVHSFMESRRIQPRR